MTKDTMSQELFDNATLPLVSANVVVDSIAAQAIEALVHAKDERFAQLVLSRWIEARASIDKAKATIEAARHL